MKTTIHQPHDALFRNYLSHIENAETFFKVYLPEDIKSLCDFSTLRLEPGSFVEKNLRKHFSDILYSVQIADERGYIYPLIEHETTARRMTPFKVFGYVRGVMDQHLKQGHLYLPVVVPLLYYRGKITPYPYTGNLFDCFGPQKELAQRVYSRPYPIIDVTVMPDDEIQTHQNIAILDFAQKYSVLNRDIQDWIDHIIKELEKGYLSSELCQTLLYYIFREADTLNIKGLLEKLKNIQTYRGDVMSVAQKLEQQGLQQGLQQGFEKGKYTEALIIAKNMLGEGMSLELIRRITKLPDLALDELGGI